jgi:hypothetical protein
MKAKTSEGYLGAWLNERLLLVAGDGSYGDDAAPQVSVSGRSLDVQTDEAFAARDGDGRVEGALPRVLLVRLPREAAIDGGRNGSVDVEIAGSRLALPPGRAGANEMDLTTLLRSRLARLEPSSREELVSFLAAACAEDLEGPGRVALASRLKIVRDALRERLPVSETEKDKPRAVAIDDILAVDSRRFWIKGWLWDVDSDCPRLEMVSPEGARVNVLEQAFRWRRRDIEQLYSRAEAKRMLNGFVACVTLPAPSWLSSGWVAELRSEAGNGVEREGPEVVRNPTTVRDLILRDFSWADRDKQCLVIDHAYPAISRVLERMANTAGVDQTFEFGNPSDDPDTSIVVSLSGQPDALEHHLIQFRSDPDMAASELIYVVDMSEEAQGLASRLSELHWLYPVPFRLITLSAKTGPTIMDNFGASIARGRRLLFLSPDVMPDRPGWLSAMTDFYGAHQGIGALGPKLLYEDQSVQHAGLGYDPVAPQEFGIPTTGSGVWQARSYFKGLPAAYSAANEARAVPAVSGACLMVDRELFESVGGFRNVYVDGEYEDADLCLRLAQAGHANWYMPQVTLYHLEGRTRTAPQKPAHQYNAILHSELWREQIEASR